MPSTGTHLRKKGRALTLVFVLLIATVGHIPLAGAAGFSVPPASETFEATEQIDVWDRAVLPLRADTSTATMTLANADWRVRDANNDETSLNDAGTTPVGVYEPGSSISLTFDLGQTDGSSAAYSGTDVHLVAAHVEESGSLVTPDNVSDALDLLTQENANANASFEIVDQSQLDTNGDASFEYTPSEAGAYVFFLATGESGKDRFTADSAGNLSVAGDVSIIGLEQAMVRKAASEVVPQQTTVKRGNAIDFDADVSSQVAGDDVQHVVAVYDEATFVNQSFVVDLHESVSRDFDIQNNSTLEHSIEEVNGVARLDDPITVADVTLNDGKVSRSVGAGAVLDFITEKTDQDPPGTVATDNIVLNASITGVNATARERITVETVDNWSTGTYRWVHVAAGADSAAVVANTGEVYIADSKPLAVSNMQLSRSSVRRGGSARVEATVTNPSSHSVEQYVGVRKFKHGSSTIDGSYGPTKISLGPGNSTTYSFTLDTSKGSWSTGTYTVEFFSSLRDNVDDPIGESQTKTFKVRPKRTDDNDDDDDDDPPVADDPPEGEVDVSESEDTVKVNVKNAKAGQNVSIKLPDSDRAVEEQGFGLEGLDVGFSQDSDFDLNVSSDAGDAPVDRLQAPGLGTLNIDHRASDDAISSVAFTFQVSKEKLENEAIASDDVVLYRYHDGRWTALQTTRIGETESTYRYEAVSPGLSVFAISTSDAAQPAFDVVDASVSTAEIAVGDSVTVSATIENNGDADGTFTAELTVDGAVVATTDATIEAGESETVSFTQQFDSAGTYEIGVNDAAAGTLTVTAQATPTPTQTPAPTPESGPEGLGLGAITLIVLLLVAVVAGGFYFLRQRGDI